MAQPPFVISEATAARRRAYLYLVDATDNLTAETGEAAGQPQYSKNGAAWGNTNATLVSIGNGGYYVELLASEIDTLGVVGIRYKSANTAERQVWIGVQALNIHEVVAAGVWGAVRATYATVGTFGEGVASVKGAVTSIAAGGIAAGVLSAAAIVEIGTGAWASVVEGSNTAGDLLRGAISALVGKATDFTTGTLVFKSLSGVKTRWTVTTNSTGRLTVTAGDLT